MKELAEGGHLEENDDEDDEIDEIEEFTDSSLSDDEEAGVNNVLGFVEPHSLEGHVKQKRRDLAERLAAVYEGRADAKRFSNKNVRTAGTNNSEKEKGNKMPNFK